MRAALLLTADRALSSRLERELPDCSVFSAGGTEEALRLLRTTDVDLLILDLPTRGAAQILAQVRRLSPSTAVVCLYVADAVGPQDWGTVRTADVLLQRPFSSEELAAVLSQAVEKQELRLEVDSLRSRRPGAPPSRRADSIQEKIEGSAALKQLARCMSSGFEAARVQEIFLDAVADLVKPSCAALLVTRDTGRRFSIVAQRGLAPHIERAVHLVADGGLPLWMGKHGRPIAAGELDVGDDAVASDVERELRMLRAVVAVPLLARGELVAILTLGPTVTGGGYAPEHVQLLFDLAGQVAATIRHRQRHQQLQYEKAYMERVLSHMSSAMIAIDRHEKVTVLNRRAEQILELSAADVIGSDLRCLPSPLGDLLYGIMRTGRPCERTEVELTLPRLPLEVTAYPVGEGDDARLGAVMLFDDISSAKQLGAERRRRESLELLTRVVGRMANELRRPLVSVQTFVDLFEERFVEPEFRERFAAVMKQDARQLAEMFDKLSMLVSERAFTFEVADMRKVIEECFAELDARAAPWVDGKTTFSFADPISDQRATVEFHAEGDRFAVSCDVARLREAIAYLLKYLVGKTPGQDARLSCSIDRPRQTEEVVHLTVSSSTAELGVDELRRIFDPVEAVQLGVAALGPLVSMKIVEAHHGWFDASQDRRGVSFTLRLPIASS